DAEVPVFQVSLPAGLTPAQAYALGQALRPLREEGVLVIGSGSLTHNLYEFRGHAIDAEAPSWVSEFDGWMKQRLDNDQRASLRDYRAQAPHAVRNHPTEEHLLPLFVAM